MFILEGNIQTDHLQNFLKKTNETHDTRNTPFDLSSLMMYGPTDYGIMDSNGGRRTTIKSVKPGVEIRYLRREKILLLAGVLKGRLTYPLWIRLSWGELTNQ